MKYRNPLSRALADKVRNAGGTYERLLDRDNKIRITGPDGSVVFTDFGTRLDHRGLRNVYLHLRRRTGLEIQP